MGLFNRTDGWVGSPTSVLLNLMAIPHGNFLWPHRRVGAHSHTILAFLLIPGQILGALDVWPFAPRLLHFSSLCVEPISIGLNSLPPPGKLIAALSSCPQLLPDNSQMAPRALTTPGALHLEPSFQAGSPFAQLQGMDPHSTSPHSSQVNFLGLGLFQVSYLSVGTT